MSKEETEIGNVGCQIQSVPKMCSPRGRDETAHLPLRRRMRLAIRKRLTQHFRRTFKKTLTGFLARWREIGHKVSTSDDPFVHPARLPLKPGDWVRVRSKEDIQTTLNPWNELRGCGFMSEMWQYCGTIQRVLKPVERFVDERDYSIRKARGVVLLEGITCNGTEFYGKCDRSCFLFWREEWLERIDIVDKPGNAI